MSLHHATVEDLHRLIATAQMQRMDAEVLERLQWLLMYAEGKPASAVCRKYGIARSTFYRWLKRFNPMDLSSLEDKDTHHEHGPMPQRVLTHHSHPVRAVEEGGVKPMQVSVKEQIPDCFLCKMSKGMRKHNRIFPMVVLMSLLLNIALITLMLAPAAQASSWDPGLLVNTEAFQIVDEGDGATDVYIQFGDSLAETITFDRTSTRFDFSDDVFVSGNLSASGTLAINSDQSGNAQLTFGNNLADQTISLAEGADDLVVSTGASFAGHLSGASLTISNLQNCDTIDTDANGNLVCGTDGGSGTGITKTDADGYYVNIGGDTMTGDLIISNSGSLTASGTVTGLNVHAERLLSTSGSLTVEQDARIEQIPDCNLIITDSNGVMRCANSSDNNLVIFETVSGTTSTDQITDVSFPNGTSLDKMFHFCSFEYDSGEDLHDQTYKATELTSISNLRIWGGQVAGGNLAVNYKCQIVIYDDNSALTVQRGSTDTLDISGLTAVDLSPTLSSLSRSFVIPHGEAHPDDVTIGTEESMELRLVGTGVGGLEIEVDTYNNAGVNRVTYEVVDWGTDDIRVQHLNDNAMTSSETTDSATLSSAVDLDKTWMIVTGRSEGAAYQEATGHINFDADITDSTTVEFYKGISGIGANWSAQIIEDVSSGGIVWNIERIALSMTGGQLTASATLESPLDEYYSIFTPTTFANFSMCGATNDTTISNNDRGHVIFELTNPNTVTATRGAADGFTLDLHAQIMTFSPPNPYLTVTTANNKYVNLDGDTMTDRLNIEMAENSEFLRLTDSTNTDSIGIYTGGSDPEGSISAQLGSLYVDHSTGVFYKKHSGDGTTTGWEELAINTGALAARMTRDAVQGIPTSVWTKILFDNEDYDYGNMADEVTNDRFDIKMDGRYFVTADWGIENLDTGDNVHVAIYINGVNTSGYRTVSPFNNEEISVSVTEVFDLSTGDYLEMYVQHTDNGNRNSNTGIYKPRMSVAMLHPAGGGGGGGGSGTGMTKTEADGYYVNIGGDTMTGDLIIENNAGLTASGALQTESGITINKDNAAQDAVLTFGNDLGAEILRFSDTNNQFEFTDDLAVLGTLSGATLSAAGGDVTVAADGTTIFNEFGDTSNFRIESNNEVNMFFLDGTNDRVGFGTASPETTVDIAGALSGDTLSMAGGDFTIAADGTTILNEFGDTSDVRIESSGNANMFFLDGANDRVGFGTSSPETTVEVNGVLSGALLNDSGSSPPVACATAHSGRMWMDTDSGELYMCDTSNSRNKWLSVQSIMTFGDESGTCDAGNDPDNDADCNVDWGNGLGPDGNSALGIYLPFDITLIGYGFSADNDACTSGSFDLEVWSTGSNADDDTYTFESSIATALDGQAHNSNSLNVDVDGNQYILWGIDNNCGQGIDDWNLVLYYRYRHD